ncbi:MAG TPA: hypothetical protein VLH08_11710 [Acidobacteriota bacterium]|nr:hypothetical protein [Acidobacteriota bacterium]
MDWLWYVVGIIITGGVLYFKLRRQKQFKDTLPIIAQSLGLKYSDRADQLPERIAAEPGLPEALSDPVRVKEIQKYAKVISLWKIEGEFNGVKVEILPRVIGSRNTGQSRYTRFNAYFTHPKTLNFTISNMGNTKLGLPEIRIGALDKKIIVKSVDEVNTQHLLNDSDVQMAITNAFKFSSEVVIDETGTHLDKHGAPPLGPEYYREALNHLTQIILRIENRSRFLNL